MNNALVGKNQRPRIDASDADWVKFYIDNPELAKAEEPHALIKIFQMLKSTPIKFPLSISRML